MTLGDTQRKIFSSTSFVLQTHWTQRLKEGPQALCNYIIKGSSCSKFCVSSTYIKQQGERGGTPDCDWKARREAECVAQCRAGSCTSSRNCSPQNLSQHFNSILLSSKENWKTNNLANFLSSFNERFNSVSV